MRDRLNNIELCASSVTVSWNADDFFDPNHLDSVCSPIDRFFETHAKLNRLCKPENIENHEVLGGLALLGSVSAVESYLREMIRRVIIIDPLALKACENAPITFGATRVHSKDTLPEALTEKYAFISGKKIREALKEFLGLNRGFPDSVETVVNDFERVCQFRHCMVHRFGKLGTHNALFLGLDTLARYIEKPLAIDYSRLQTIFLVNYNTVKTLNNFLLQQLLQRSSKEPGYWKWDLRRDKRQFRRYYDLFYSQQQPPSDNDGLLVAYRKFKATCGPSS